MSSIAVGATLVVYLAATLGLLVYGLNCYVMLSLFARRRRAAGAATAAMRARWGDLLARSDLPVVTTQVAVYNEFNVVAQVMRAAAAMEYPAGRHEVQILDDSTDETRGVIDRLAQELRAAGRDIKVIRRPHRTGFKAGALANGLEQARGELVAVFDADFIPPPDYLLNTVPCFLENPRLGFVQTRWGHLNRLRSLLTRAQSIGIDGHFIVEQIGRCWNRLYMNFNGTAGVWRCAAIRESGGWQWDTLTEDLDLSYRVQFAGWETLYLPDVVVPAELPEDVNAFRGQQFRWAKGSFQTVLKLTPDLMRMPVSPFKKVQALLHMSGYAVHPMMLSLAILALPMLYITANFNPCPWFFIGMSLPLCFSIVAPTTLYFVSQKVAYRDWLARVAMLPVLIVVGVGLAMSNTRAIFEAITGRESEFVRTPKRGQREIKRYRIRLPWVSVFEILLGLYCAWSLGRYVAAQRYLVSPFLAIYAAGFLYIGLLTVCHALGGSGRRPSLS